MTRCTVLLSVALLVLVGALPTHAQDAPPPDRLIFFDHGVSGWYVYNPITPDDAPQPVLLNALSHPAPEPSPIDGTLAYFNDDGLHWTYQGVPVGAPPPPGLAPGDVSDLAWSPDGRWLALSYSTDDATGVLVLDAATGVATEVVEPITADDDGHLWSFYASLRWSPDGDVLAVTEIQQDAPYTQLVTISCLHDDAQPCTTRRLEIDVNKLGLDGDTFGIFQSTTPLWDDDGTLTFSCGPAICAIALNGTQSYAPRADVFAPDPLVLAVAGLVSPSGRWAAPVYDSATREQRLLDLTTNTFYPLPVPAQRMGGWVWLGPETVFVYLSEDGGPP